MARPNPYRPFTPDPEFVALLPEKKGCATIGLGETEVRPPTMVWWAPDMDAVDFGDAQKWFYQHEPPDPVLMEKRAERRAILNAPLPELALTPAQRTPREWTDALNRFVADGLCEMVGATAMRPEWVFDHQETEFGTVVMLGVQHDYDELKHVPETRGGIEVTRQYCRAAAAAKAVAGWLREEGWDAAPVTGPMVGEILMIPPALECGFGELGKHGSLINREFGSAFRLGAVLTDAPFAHTPKRTFGVDDFCTRCRVCEDACPPFAIGPEKQMVRGVEKWFVDFDKCIPFFAETSGCAICIAVCPWSRPGVGMNLAEKLARRSDREQADE
ncbi:4Fe-4S dicluster domain-containing protein [Hoeflea poritis]|uniref:4Fe-4S dicluster domain-containing protein n=1 Tax=Hoeflea poritis TaxID=2993659 RepID=A0ABT4VQP1_9HYPH|nr:4Fe-4S dicluster domain-containing protein [Hoeflea poritis]MDA4847026.1 4Fe-4S dicluster domain-containing protein [Hoeflea poritis]